MPSKAPSFWSRPAPAMLVVIAAVVIGCSAALALHRRREDRLHRVTGRAEWIWYARAGRKPRPLRFYATREVELAAVPRRAEARFFVDPEYALYVNGLRVDAGRRRAADALAVVDLVPVLRPGSNRIAIEAASPDGVGGILFSVDGEGLDVNLKDAFASNVSWRVSLDPAAVTQGGGARAIVWGSPPQYPWGYPRLPAAGGVPGNSN
jgi:hypothetical protein